MIFGCSRSRSHKPHHPRNICRSICRCSEMNMARRREGGAVCQKLQPAKQKGIFLPAAPEPGFMDGKSDMLRRLKDPGPNSGTRPCLGIPHRNLQHLAFRTPGNVNSTVHLPFPWAPKLLDAPFTALQSTGPNTALQTTQPARTPRGTGLSCFHRTRKKRSLPYFLGSERRAERESRVRGRLGVPAPIGWRESSAAFWKPFGFHSAAWQPKKGNKKRAQTPPSFQELFGEAERGLDSPKGRWQPLVCSVGLKSIVPLGFHFAKLRKELSCRILNILSCLGRKPLSKE